MSRAERQAARQFHRQAVNDYYRQNGILPAEREPTPAPPKIELFSDEWYTLLPPDVADIVRNLKAAKGDPRQERTHEPPGRADQPTDHVHPEVRGRSVDGERGGQ